MWQYGLPKKLSRLFIECPEFVVVVSSANEKKAARSYNAAAVIFRARIFHPFRYQLRILAERNLPGVIAGIEIDSRQRTPRWGASGVTVRIEKFFVRFHCVLQPAGRPCRDLNGDTTVGVVQQIGLKSVDCIVSQ